MDFHERNLFPYLPYSKSPTIREAIISLIDAVNITCHLPLQVVLPKLQVAQVENIRTTVPMYNYLLSIILVHSIRPILF